jgi:FkbM family methyltransferase
MEQHVHTSIATTLTKLANWAGYQLMPKWRAKSYEQAQLVRRLLDSREIDLVLDVGSNTGQFGNWIRLHCGYCGNIVSVEPVDAAYRILERNVATDPKWTTHRIALGSVPGRKMINLTRGVTLASFLQPIEHPPAGVIRAGNLEVTGSEEVEVYRLEDFLGIAGIIARKIFLKVDTQGYDLEVLKGAGSAIDRLEIIQLELSVLPLYQGATDWIEFDVSSRTRLCLSRYVSGNPGLC